MGEEFRIYNRELAAEELWVQSRQAVETIQLDITDILRQCGIKQPEWLKSLHPVED
ncbi:hypothetical protein D3C74_80890 [compost metagenome]